MKGDFRVRAIPSKLLLYTLDGEYKIAVDTTAYHKAKTVIFTGDRVNYELLAPSKGKCLIIKGVSILGDGNSGVVKILRSSNNEVLYPAYFSAQVKGQPSPAYNYKLLPDEKVLYTTVSRGSVETFLGVTYIEFDPLVDY